MLLVVHVLAWHKQVVVSHVAPGEQSLESLQVRSQAEFDVAVAVVSQVPG